MRSSRRLAATKPKVPVTKVAVPKPLRQSSRRLAAVPRSPANGAIGLRVHHRLAGKHRFDSKQALARKTVFAPQRFAHALEQGVVRGLGEIGGHDGGWVAAAPCPAHRHDRRAAAHAKRDEVRLDLRAVDGVHDPRKTGRQDLFRVTLEEEGMQRVDLAIRVDDLDALFEHVDLRPAKGPVVSVQLAVDVGDADVVEIHDRQAANAGPGQGFDGPRTHASHPDDAEVGMLDALGGRETKQAADAAESG